jgi:hypothetical protein
MPWFIAWRGFSIPQNNSAEISTRKEWLYSPLRSPIALNRMKVYPERRNVALAFLAASS